MSALTLRSCCSLQRLLKIERNVSLNKSGNSLRVFSTKDDDFETVYNLPHIKLIAPLCSTPKYIVPLGVATLPLTAGLEFVAGIMPANCTLLVGLGGLLFTVISVAFGQVFRNTIGFMYVSDDKKNIKIAHIDRWGNRINRIIPTEDWVPLSELPSTMTDKFYLTTKQYSSDDKYKLFYAQGQVFNEELVKSTIGTPF